MAEAQELQLQVMVHGDKENGTEQMHNTDVNRSSVPRPRTYLFWVRISFYILFVLFGQTVAVLLGRLYYNNGGKSKWMATLVQLVGFPILLPLYAITRINQPSTTRTSSKSPSTRRLVAVYLTLGLLVAGGCYIYAVGLLYLPVSTFSIISASQLAFNAFFSYFLNAQKFTPFIINSLVLLTISSTLLGIQSNSANTASVSKEKYAIGFVCTILSAAGYGLNLSLTQLCFQKVLKKHTFAVVLDMIIYQSFVAVCVTLVGLFASGEWSDLSAEMEQFETGKGSYLMVLIWTAISWEVYAIGLVGLIFEVSSLFSNSIGVVGLPIVPVLAVIFFHDKMDGVKVVSMVLAIWGFISYGYQHYIDDQKLKTGNSNASESVDSDSAAERS